MPEHAGVTFNLAHVVSRDAHLFLSMNERSYRWQMSSEAHFTVSLMFKRTNRPTAADKLNMTNDDVYAQASYIAAWKESHFALLLISYKPKADKLSIATTATAQRHTQTSNKRVSVFLRAFHVGCNLL